MTWTITITNAIDDDDITTAWDIIPALNDADGIATIHRRREYYDAWTAPEYDGDDRIVCVTADNGERLVFGFDAKRDDDHITIVGWSYSCYRGDDEYPWTTDGDPIETPDDIDTKVIPTIRQWAADIAARMDEDI